MISIKSNLKHTWVSTFKNWNNSLDSAISQWLKWKITKQFLKWKTIGIQLEETILFATVFIWEQHDGVRASGRQNGTICCRLHVQYVVERWAAAHIILLSLSCCHPEILNQKLSNVMIKATSKLLFFLPCLFEFYRSSFHPN